MPTISVIIPAYNAEKTIKETLDSVLNQTFKDFEVIIINDGSTDRTLDIISDCSDPRVQVFSYPNSGPQKSRNRGITQAVGEYLSFLDADDLWTPDKLERQLKALQDNPDAAVAYSWTNWVDESGNFLRRGSYLSREGDIYAKLLLTDFIENGSNPLIRSDAIAAVGGFDESLPAAQDWDMWLRLAECYHFVAVPAVQILYRQSAKSWSCNVDRMEVASLRVITRACDRGSDSIKRLKHDILANRYKGLTFKTLEGLPHRKRGITAMRFLGLAIKNDPSLLRAGVLGKILFKILAMIVLPPQQAEALFNKYKNFSNINALLGYLRMDPS